MSCTLGIGRKGRLREPKQEHHTCAKTRKLGKLFRKVVLYLGDPVSTVRPEAISSVHSTSQKVILQEQGGNTKNVTKIARDEQPGQLDANTTKNTEAISDVTRDLAPASSSISLGFNGAGLEGNAPEQNTEDNMRSSFPESKPLSEGHTEKTRIGAHWPLDIPRSNLALSNSLNPSKSPEERKSDSQAKDGSVQRQKKKSPLRRIKSALKNIFSDPISTAKSVENLKSPKDEKIFSYINDPIGTELVYLNDGNSGPTNKANNNKGKGNATNINSVPEKKKYIPGPPNTTEFRIVEVGYVSPREILSKHISKAKKLGGELEKKTDAKETNLTSQSESFGSKLTLESNTEKPNKKPIISKECEGRVVDEDKKEEKRIPEDEKRIRYKSWRDVPEIDLKKLREENCKVKQQKYNVLRSSNAHLPDNFAQSFL